MSMRARVVLPREEPFGVDAELANEGGNAIDEEVDIDRALVLSDEASQGIRRQPEDGGERVERVTGTLTDGPDAPGDGFDERIVDRQRQARAPLQGIGQNRAFHCKSDARRSGLRDARLPHDATIIAATMCGASPKMRWRKFAKLRR